ncbi:MAG TPA: ADOP family duplicated permease [Thermoanaerobaculia bacterium]|jgi:putative ABC transport system permease protein|nr:ADOP family duplicated permease [Thermoanaerobaculia bacterium]
MEILRALRRAVRRLAGASGLSAAVVLCVALGVGAVTGAFSLVEAVLLRPLPYPQPERLVMLWSRAVDGSNERIVVSQPDFLDWRQRSTSFSQLASFSVWFPSLTLGDRSDKVLGSLVSADFFAALGARPVLGRTFLPEEEQPGRDAVVVLGHGLWRSRFGGDPGVLGRRIVLDGVPHTVIGVLPADFRHPEPLYLQETTELWKPLALAPAGAAAPIKTPRGMRFLRALGRLAPGVTPERARADLDAIAHRLESEHPGDDEGLGIRLVPLHEQLSGDLRPALRLALAAAAMVLLVACCNVSGLLLAGSARRAHEMAVRAALGAGRGRLARQALADSLLLALAGGVLGAGAALPATRALLALSPRMIPGGSAVTLDARVLAVALGACLVTAILAGLAPAARAARRSPALVLRESAPSVGDGAGRALALLLLLQIAIALPLLAATGLLAKTLTRLAAVPLGFTTGGVLTLRLELPSARYPKPADQRAFHDRLLALLAATPGVRTAGLTSSLPLTGLYDITREVDVDQADRPVARGESAAAIAAGYRAVSPGYFPALRVPLLQGRPFDPHDAEGAPPVVLVNETFARTAWPHESALGKTLVLRGAPVAVRREVVGVVRNVRHTGPATEPRAEIYLPLAQAPARFTTLVLLTPGDPAALAPAVRQLLRGIDPDLGAASVQPMDRLKDAALAGPRFWLALALVLGAAAALLVGLGVYALAADAVGRRTREIGVRMALGATRSEILRLVLRRSLLLALLGVALGLAAALALTRLLTGLLYGVAPTDLLSLAAAGFFLLVLVTAATWPAARRAAGLEPVRALTE